jgi:hypothetical protein
MGTAVPPHAVLFSTLQKKKTMGTAVPPHVPT